MTDYSRHVFNSPRDMNVKTHLELLLTTQRQKCSNTAISYRDPFFAYY